ncbi:MAG TPA: hypothetical protein VFG88_04005 [Nocardioidaceae bacterium]|jgi:hypothetical protein|nr:hypothetical protein [Nocardioidaceae bacterium]
MADHDEPVGSLAEEAAKLFDALNEHVATGDPECRYCPICRVVSTVRHTSPEVRQHLAGAASSLLEAASGLAAAYAASTRGAGAGHGGVEKIDLDDPGEDAWDEDPDGSDDWEDA